MYYYSPYYGPLFELPLEERHEDKTKKMMMFMPLEETFIKGNVVKEQYCPYHNYTPVMPKGKSEQEQLLIALMAYGHNIHDLILYLDVYPSNMQALQLMQEYQNKYQTLENDYVRKYGPLCKEKGQEENEFVWVKIKSPWLGN